MGSRYLTPLPGMLAAAVEQAIARAVALDDGSPERLRPLHDKLVRLELKGLGIDLFFQGRDDALSVTAEHEATPDTTISGTPLALLAMAVPDWRAPGSGVRIEGDAGTGQAFEKLLKQLDPDWEAVFVERFGPVVGHQLWRTLSEARAGARHVGRTAAEQTARFLREESGLLVSREEIDEFVNEVDELREAADRLEARLRRRDRT
ncbi:ubiquinone biosynthesis accessory factor UbiJ [Wenzhouxiangella sediminis]|uniref:Ubiquinone biosynthesis accessory factor UbiJ n=1 Tax=Wenzhouxiangella sediminis TaxID=1792836 RepID=A0A3E1K6U6_9GAMM|nr:SCP2 sterol-binding domain-containing protein [Wenzhouxiangella sediminis]RFF29728.1 sterol-binding protein [Wenzhouxiangella sediminis]